MLINNNINYITSTFLFSVIFVIAIGFILSFFNFSSTYDYSYGLTTLNLIIYLFVIFGVLLTIILNVYFKHTPIENISNILLDNFKFFMVDLLPIVLIVVSVISLTLLNNNYNVKINSGNLSNNYYTFNKVYLAILFFQFLNLFIYFKNKINNKDYTIFNKIINYILSFTNIIITLIIWTEAVKFSTDG